MLYRIARVMLAELPRPRTKNANGRTLNWPLHVLFVSNIACAQNAAPDQTVWAQATMAKKCYANEYELAQCLSQLRIEEEAKLEGLRSKVRAEVEEEQRKPFDDLDDEWKKYRQASCEFDAALAAGNSKSARFGNCMLTHTQFRVSVLSKYLAGITTGRYGNGVGLYMFEFGLAGAGD